MLERLRWNPDRILINDKLDPEHGKGEEAGGGGGVREGRGVGKSGQAFMEPES